MENSNTLNNPRKKSKWGKRLMIIIAIFLVAFFAYVFICGRSYSVGTRTGIVIKLSHKGYMIKTYEGELNLG